MVWAPSDCFYFLFRLRSHSDVRFEISRLHKWGKRALVVLWSLERMEEAQRSFIEYSKSPVCVIQDPWQRRLCKRRSYSEPLLHTYSCYSFRIKLLRPHRTVRDFLRSQIFEEKNKWISVALVECPTLWIQVTFKIRPITDHSAHT